MSKKKKVEEKAEPPKGYSDTFDMSSDDIQALTSQIERDMVDADTNKDTWRQERLKDIRAYFGIKKQSDWPFKGAANGIV